MVEYACKHCQGTAQITVLVGTEKATEPVIEFCPFCGMSNCYLEGLLMVPNKFFNESREQSLIKAEIFEKYFDAWAGIITATQNRVGREKRIVLWESIQK